MAYESRYAGYLGDVRRIVEDQAQTGIEAREKAYMRAHALLVGRPFDAIERIQAEIALAEFLAGE